MQLGGIGSDHSSDMHQVTTCLHDHDNNDKLDGGMKLSKSGAAAQQALRVNQEQEAQFSFADLLQKLLRNGKQRLWNFWNGSEADVTRDKAGKSDKPQVMAQLNDTSVTNGAETAARETLLQGNPYFAVAEPPKSTGIPFIQKLKLKCKNVAGQLAQHLPKRFFNFQKKGAFHAKKEGSREDLRKRSRYHQDSVEIDCVLTDESYLMDSYDRRGEYSQLTTKK